MNIPLYAPVRSSVGKRPSKSHPPPRNQTETCDLIYMNDFKEWLYSKGTVLGFVLFCFFLSRLNDLRELKGFGTDCMIMTPTKI